MLSPEDQWRAETQFVAAPNELPPIEMMERFDSVHGKVDVGLMIFNPAIGFQFQLNYSGVFSETTQQHGVKGGLAYKF